MRILMTGTSGLIGQSLSRTLSKHEVFDIRSLGSGDGEFKIDFSRPWESGLLPKEIDTIVHLAQSPNYKNFPEKALEIFTTNTLSTAKLLDYAYRSGVKHFIFASTGGIYTPSNSFISENSHLLPIGDLSHYFSSKLSSEMLCNSYSSIMDITILRPFFVFGPRQSNNMLIPRLAQNIINGVSVDLAGQNGIRINPIYVEDAVRLISGVIEQRICGVYNLSGNEIVSIRELSQMIANFYERDVNFKNVKESLDLVSDNSQLMRAFANFTWTPLKLSLISSLKLLK